MFGNFFVKIFYLGAVAFLFSSIACRTPPKTEMKNLAPQDALIYLETSDVARTLGALAASPAFQESAKDKPDFSALENVQMAIVVSGFETSETDSALNLKPRFVALVETHAWSWQTVSFAENQIDDFVRKNYGDDAKLEKTDESAGKFFIWTANDGRQTFAFVAGSLIYFGNDRAGLEKCLAVKKAAGESLAKNESFKRAYTENNLAFGYVSAEAVKQIADLAGVSAAVNASGAAEERNFIARVVPQILRNTTGEIVWTANRAPGGIEDKFSVGLNAETAAVLNEILSERANASADLKVFLPADVFSATQYNLKNPLLAWRGLLLLTAKNTDVLSGKILMQFSDKLLEPYGVADAETFLQAIDAPILTAQLDANGEQSVSAVVVKDAAKLKTSLSEDINFKLAPEKISGAEVWFSSDKKLAAAFVENFLILGDGVSVLKCLTAKTGGQKSSNNSAFQKFAASGAVASTFGRDVDAAEKTVRALASARDENRRLATFYATETRFTAKGFERITVSDFGVIGTILENLVGRNRQR